MTVSRRSIVGGLLIQACAVLFCSVVSGTASAGLRRQESELGVKAAFVYNFTKFVTWPASAFSSSSAPFVMGIVGEDAIQAPLEAIVRNKQVAGRSIVIRHIGWSDVETCNLLFIPNDESARATQLAKLKGRNILIVSESPGMIRKGASINLFIEQERVLFEISGSASKDTGLTISSHLMSLARTPH